jgi:hypothetical protein
MVAWGPSHHVALPLSLTHSNWGPKTSSNRVIAGGPGRSAIGPWKAT